MGIEDVMYVWYPPTHFPNSAMADNCRSIAPTLQPESPATRCTPPVFLPLAHQVELHSILQSYTQRFPPLILVGIALKQTQPTDATMGVRSYFQKIKRRRAYGYNKKSKFNSSSFSGVGSTKSALSGFGKKGHVDLQRRDIDKVVKEATSKHLYRPDTGLNQKVGEVLCYAVEKAVLGGGAIRDRNCRDRGELAQTPNLKCQ